MAGYSGTPLLKKLGIKPGHCVAILNGPSGIKTALKPLPEKVRLISSADGERLDAGLVFVRSQDDLRADFARVAAALQPAGGLWVCWPKKASGIVTDLTEDVIREIGLAHGLVDNKVCAVDETWSGLRFVIRLADRKGR